MKENSHIQVYLTELLTSSSLRKLPPHNVNVNTDSAKLFHHGIEMLT